MVPKNIFFDDDVRRDSRAKFIKMSPSLFVLINFEHSYSADSSEMSCEKIGVRNFRLSKQFGMR